MRSKFLGIILILGLVVTTLITISPKNVSSSGPTNPKTQMWYYHVPYYPIKINGWSASLNIVNLGLETPIGVRYHRPDGGFQLEPQYQLNPHQQLLIWEAGGRVPAGFSGSVEIQSYSPLAVSIHLMGPNGVVMGYPAIPSVGNTAISY